MASIVLLVELLGRIRYPVGVQSDARVRINAVLDEGAGDAGATAHAGRGSDGATEAPSGHLLRGHDQVVNRLRDALDTESDNYRGDHHAQDQ